MYTMEESWYHVAWYRCAARVYSGRALVGCRGKAGCEGVYRPEGLFSTVREAFSSCSTHAYHAPPRMVTSIPSAFARVMVRLKIATESKIVKTCFTLAMPRVSKTSKGYRMLLGLTRYGHIQGPDLAVCSEADDVQAERNEPVAEQQERIPPSASRRWCVPTVEDRAYSTELAR